MQATGKPSIAKILETSPDLEMKAKEQQALDNLIRQTIVSDSFLSFSRAGESSVQWVHWLDTIDQQNTNKGSKNSKLEVGLDAKDNTRQEEVLASHATTGEAPSIKDSLHSSIKGSSMFGRGLQPSADRFHSLKFPEAMVAFAQAAAKANELPGWPLMSNKVQMQKCEKCPQEFCSSLNHRRHMRATHRRPLNADKEDLKKKREQVAAYWDKLAPEEACEIVSVRNISIPDLSAASLVRALSTHLQQPGLLSLPQSYVKIATSLLDIVQNKSSKFPLQSEELLNILEEASEKNLLCGTTSTSMQRCIFDSEPGRVGLETKNLVASLGFLVELKLVRAWMDDKDVEALRCQKALMEEEEAAQKKLAKLQERKRQKKMRQKESKERRGSESSTNLQMLKFDPFSGDSCTGHGEGDDSATATQSSPSSSGYSGQDPSHLEASQMDLHEMEGYGDGKAESKKSRLTDEQQGLHCDFDDQQQVCWSGSTALSVAGHPESFGGEDASHGDSCVIYEDANVQASSNHDFQGPEVQNSLSDQRGEMGRSLSGNFLPERKVLGRGWRERRQNDASDFSSYQRQPYNYDRRYYDYSYGSQRVPRKPYNVAGTSGSEYLGTYKLNATPRYGQYREKLSGVHRPSPAASSGHAVWARKASQNPASDFQPDEKDNLGVLEAMNPPSDTADRQSEHVIPEDACSDGSNPTACAGTADFISVDACPATLDKVGGLSRNSSLSLDSITSHSSVSVSARVGAEEQVHHEDFTVSDSFANQSLPDHISGVDLAGGRTEEENSSSWDLVVGSLRIPLGDAWSSVTEDTSLPRNSEAVLGGQSRDVKNLQVERSSLASVGTGQAIPDTSGSAGREVAAKVSSDSLQGVEACHFDTSRETYLDAGGLSQTVAGEEIPCPVNSSTEKLVKQGTWPSGVSKLGMKVWRPVALGDRGDSLSTTPLSGTEAVEEHGPDVTKDSVSEAGRPSSPYVVSDTGDEDAAKSVHTGSTQGGGFQEAAGFGGAEAPCSRSVESDAFETSVSHEESFDHQYRVEDGAEASTGRDLNSAPQLAVIASFLSHRWAVASASSDSVELTMHLREPDDSTPSLCLQDDEALHRVDCLSEADGEYVRHGAGWNEDGGAHLEPRSGCSLPSSTT